MTCCQKLGCRLCLLACCNISYVLYALDRVHLHGCGVECVGAASGENDWLTLCKLTYCDQRESTYPKAIFVKRIVRVSDAFAVLTEPDSLRFPVLETNHGMLPSSVSESDAHGKPGVVFTSRQHVCPNGDH